MTKSIKILTFGLFLTFINSVNAQHVFKKGTLLVSISGGNTNANYTTTEISTGKICKNVNMDGIRDPLFFEYGISNRFGIGFSSGSDLFDINPKTFYNINGETPLNKNLVAKTSELTFDINYHAFVRRNLDVSLYTSIGSFGVTLKEKEDKYVANGGIIRAGINARYYFLKRLGVLGMASVYSADSSPKDLKGNTFGQGYKTNITGYALEFGFCFRIIR
ncbi:MAG: hypothetical protein HQ463_09075 [Bacteroidetes bacterium]|nr:hypothetical protein [Bacteroidota bacterium]